MLLQLHQRHTGDGRVAPLVAAFDARAMQGLLPAVASEDAVTDRNRVIDGKGVKPRRGFRGPRSRNARSRRG